ESLTHMPWVGIAVDLLCWRMSFVGEPDPTSPGHALVQRFRDLYHYPEMVTGVRHAFGPSSRRPSAGRKPSVARLSGPANGRRAHNRRSRKFWASAHNQ